jgi:hypothetical protein
MSEMFAGCDNLNKIYVGSDWSGDSVKSSYGMFAGCNNLVGGAGTVYDENHTDAEYARIDGGRFAPGYFTSADKNTIVIYVPEEIMDAMNYLYEGIDNPVVKDVISSAKDIISKYISIIVI